MSNPSVENLVIVGTGCAGLTAAVYAGRANLNPLVIERGAARRPADHDQRGRELSRIPGGGGRIPAHGQPAQAGGEVRDPVREALVQSVDFSSTPRRLVCSDSSILARSIIIATGASPRMTGIPGEQELYGGKGVTTCATCDGAFYRGREVAEEALFLTRFASKVYLVHRRDSLRASKIMAERATSHPKIQPVWDSIPVEVVGVREGAVSGLKVRNAKTGSESVLPVKGIFVAIGHMPNTGPFAAALDVDENGYFKPEAGSQVKTRVPGVYVAGDCADHVYRQAVTAAGMGCQAAIEAERWLSEHSG